MICDFKYLFLALPVFFWPLYAEENGQLPPTKEPLYTLAELKLSNRGIEIIEKIKKSIASGYVHPKPQDDSDPIETIEEAFDFMNMSISMAYVPQKYLEDDEAFYFSGGTTSEAVLDFSSGIAVNKKDRTITSWKSAP